MTASVVRKDTSTGADRRQNLPLMVVADLAFFAAAYYCAYLVRFDGEIPPRHLDVFEQTLIPLLLCKLTIAHVFGLYRGMWRYTSLVDLIAVFKAVGLSSLIIFSAMLFNRSVTGFSRGVLLLDALLALLFIAGLRVAIRIYFTQGAGQLFAGDFTLRTKTEAGKKNLLIVGAGDAGEAVLREIRNSTTSPYRAIGFVDDDPALVGKYIHGTPVLGDVADIPEIVRTKAVAEILIAKARATSREIRAIVEVGESIGVKCRIIPSVSEFLDERVSLQSVRDVSFEDLLGREPVRLEQDRIGRYLTGKRVLVTGAGGSIGSELCRQICRFQPEMLYMLDRSESSLYDIQMELQHHTSARVKHQPLLCGVQNVAHLRRVFEECRPHVVFHAAAYKHVPMLELHPWEAIFANVVGTRNVLDMCRDFAVERFVLVSTDKAVRPTNVMGTTKRVAELLTQCYDMVNTTTTHQAVRFGNVAGSAGSVIPLFKKQIEKRGVITVTHPEITRYFMTIPEAAQLILQAGAMGHGGEIFLLDMGSPIKIVDLARDLVRLSGFEPDVDIPIEFIGLRPGEKLYEELITEGEGIVPTEHQKIMVLKPELPDAATMEARYQQMLRDVDELMAMADARDGNGIRRKLKSIVPEFTDEQAASAGAVNTAGDPAR